MFVEFRVKNFRSFKEEAVFSLVASAAHKEHQGTHVIPIPKSVPFKVPGLLRSAAIYGANASGKSNLMRALQLLRGIVVDSAQLQPSQTLNLQPFVLDDETKRQPIEMEVTFLHEGTRYQYGFTARPERILSEWLLAYRSSKPQTWFSREFSAENQMDRYDFGASFQGQRELWKKATRPNALFLSTAIQLNSEQLRPVYEWISQIVVFERGGAPNPFFTIEHILRTPEHRVQALLHSADIGITKIDIDKRTAKASGFKFDTQTGQIEVLPPESNEVNVPLFLHKAPRGSAVFSLEDESDGTQRLFHLAGPIFEIMQSGRTLCVDELDRSLHPLLVRQLVEMFYDPAINTGGAQLIFTTHDTTLLSADILRRDQVWFAEKDQGQASRLFPLTDFSTRKSEAFEKGYLSGRYGAIPILNPKEVPSREK